AVADFLIAKIVEGEINGNRTTYDGQRRPSHQNPRPRLAIPGFRLFYIVHVTHLLKGWVLVRHVKARFLSRRHSTTFSRSAFGTELNIMEARLNLAHRYLNDDRYQSVRSGINTYAGCGPFDRVETD